MSLLGIDIGTTGCKAVVFSMQGEQLAKSYRDYEIISEKEGYAELNSVEVWDKVQEAIGEVAMQMTYNPIEALSVSSLGEAMVPVSKDGKIMGNSILGSDQRGAEFTELVQNKCGSSEIFRITGNLPGSFYSMPKIAWIKKYRPVLYHNTDYFLTWADFVCLMLGGEPVTNYSLAGRTLLFDINNCTWSDKLFHILDIDKQKFAPPRPSGSFLGYVRNELAKQLHLVNDVAIVCGGHDQCCATLGSGIQNSSNAAMYGMGTFICVVPVFSQMPDITSMYANKLHIEHHVVPGSFISFIYNQSGGAMVKWAKQTFFTIGQQDCGRQESTYKAMFDEIPNNPSDILVIPKFGSTGPPDFLYGSKGCISGLSLNHSRGDILRAMLEGISFYILDCFENLHNTFDEIDTLVVTGGGSVSEKWLQITADVLNKVIVRNSVTEASSLGAAILAGKGSNMFVSYSNAISAMVHKELTIVPDQSKKDFYNSKFNRYKILAK